MLRPGRIHIFQHIKIGMYDEWGDVSNEEIEEAMSNVEVCKRHFSEIHDRIYSNKYRFCTVVAEEL